jgi:glycosyltransferase involved in cell wall biosynthesis
MAKKLLSVIIPAYKQEKTIKDDLLNLDSVLNLKDSIKNYDYELICVVDGEIDKTFEEAEKAAKLRPNLKVVGYKVNKGKGNAVRYGMARSHGDVIAFIDAGMDLDKGSLIMALQHFEWYDADIVVGSKRHPASYVEYPWQRKIFSFFYQLLVKILFGLNIRDTQVGLKIFRREVLEKTLPRLLVKEFAFDIEMLSVANYLGFTKIYESPVRVKMDFGAGSVLTSKGMRNFILKMLRDTLAVFYRLRILNYYSDKNQRKWVMDPDLNFRVNVG